MPKQYEGIRDALIQRGMSPDQAKSHAARIFIAKSKSKAGRSTRAKSLQGDRPAPVTPTKSSNRPPKGGMFNDNDGDEY